MSWMSPCNCFCIVREILWKSYAVDGDTLGGAAMGFGVNTLGRISVFSFHACQHVLNLKRADTLTWWVIMNEIQTLSAFMTSGKISTIEKGNEVHPSYQTWYCVNLTNPNIQPCPWYVFISWKLFWRIHIIGNFLQFYTIEGALYCANQCYNDS